VSKQNCIVIGASHAGVSLALQLRKEGWSGNIELIGAENELPYHRPPLSKEHLLGVKQLSEIRLRPESTFIENEIKLSLGSTVTNIDPREKKILVGDGESLSYGKLALCTGAVVTKLPLGQELGNVFYLRSASDVNNIKSSLPGKRHVVIIGAGYIGLESAAIFRKLGLNVTIIEIAERILKRVSSEPLSNHIQYMHEKEGVEFRLATSVQSIEGDGQVNCVICDNGEEINTDLVLVGVGISSNVTLARDAGLSMNQGIIVDQNCQTSDSEIYAAGDCTEYMSSIYNRFIRLESVQNANDQARCAAANIAGKDINYEAVPWFWSDQYDTKIQIAGLSYGATEVVSRGKVNQDSGKGFALFYLQDSRIIAADCVNRPKEFLVSKQLVKDKSIIPPSVLADESIEPINFKEYLA
jgi:3-phenylpropionate/trans-cinnamate dioxygenase ferredoxin reductase subunit